jgi:hypothetical protein
MGLVPYFTKDLKKTRQPINARSETIGKSAMFREAFTERRCLVPAAAYYEWRDDPDGKTPLVFNIADLRRGPLEPCQGLIGAAKDADPTMTGMPPVWRDRNREPGLSVPCRFVTRPPCHPATTSRRHLTG